MNEGMKINYQSKYYDYLLSQILRFIKNYDKLKHQKIIRIASIGRDCHQKNIEVWLLEASKAIENSKMTGVTLPDLPIIERTIAQQQETLLEKCSVSTP